MQPLISVIVPVYKVEQYLDKCIQSIQTQTYSNLEIILVDDGSPDNCGTICDKYAQKDARIKVIHQKNGGVSRARNVGMDQATGDIIAFVDSDDFIESNMFEKMMAYMQQHNLDLVCCDTKVVKNGKIKYRPKYAENKIFVGQEGVNEIISGRLDNAVWNKLYKKRIIEGVRFPVDRRYEDVATTYLFISKSEITGYIKDGLYNYMKNSGGLIANSFNCRNRYESFLAYKEQFEFAEKHSLACTKDSRKNAIENSLATLTAYYANNEPENCARFQEVVDFIEANKDNLKCEKLKLKFKVLLWAFDNMPIVHKFYAWLSKLSKSL